MRKPTKVRRDIAPDPKFGNVVVAKFINQIMRRGKKTIAQAVLYDAFEHISQSAKQDPLQVFDSALRNVSPVLEVKPRRIGGANYQIAIEVRPQRRQTLAMRWILEATRAKKGAPMSKRLADELLAAAKKEGGAMKKRDDVHRMAESNRAFSHFAR
jgi:small subunit ribosomal protein S7